MTTLNASVCVLGSGGAISKDSHVGTQPTKGAQVSSQYANNSAANKYVCGSTGNPFKTTGFVCGRDNTP